MRWSSAGSEMSRTLSSDRHRWMVSGDPLQRWLPIVVILLMLIPGCESGSARQQLTVFAASSLTDVLPVLKAEFERTRPDTELQLVFGGSQILRLQIEQGAMADLFISAHPEHVQSLIDQGILADPEPVVENPLVVIIAPDQASSITRFEQLSEIKRLVVGDAAVPLGSYTEEVIQKADAVMGSGFAEQLRSSVVSKESNSRLVRSKVLLGEADAAFVYKSDARNTAVGIVELPEPLSTRARYVLATREVGDGDLARQFRVFLGSDRAMQIFREHEFPILEGMGASLEK